MPKSAMMNQGIFRIRNLENGKCLYGWSHCLSNRKIIEFWDLRTKRDSRGKKVRHPSKQMQKDWNRYGEEAFVFEVLAILEITELSATERKIYPLGEYNYNA